MQLLNRKTSNQPAVLPLRIIQFGGGNFLRAFVDWMVQVLNEKTDFNGGVAVIKPTERGDYADLKSQDGLFHVLLDGIKNGQLVSEKTLVSSVQKVIHAYNEWESYLELAKNPDVRFVVSNTTEAGIKFNGDDNVDDAPPKEFPAKLTIWLYTRFEHFKGDVAKGCILLPCELIENNGEALKDVIMKYADHWNLGDDFKNWINTSNHFCSTLVDRIVSGYPSDRAEEVKSELGFEDKLLVAGEQYHSWVIQGSEAVSKELPFSRTDLNVEFVNDLAPYREMKVRILNGAHTSMVPVGYLAGIRLVKEAMDDADVSAFVESLLLKESITTLDFPEEVKHKFVNDVLDRFRNPSLKHQLISISLNSTSKFVARLLPTLKDFHAAQGRLPERIVFGLACLIRFYKGKFDGESIPLKDDQQVLDFFKSVWSKFENEEASLEQTIQRILENSEVWGESLDTISGLKEMTVGYIENIENQGIKPILKTLK